MGATDGFTSASRTLGAWAPGGSGRGAVRDGFLEWNLPNSFNFSAVGIGRQVPPKFFMVYPFCHGILANLYYIQTFLGFLHFEKKIESVLAKPRKFTSLALEVVESYNLTSVLYFSFKTSSKTHSSSAASALLLMVHHHLCLGPCSVVVVPKLS